MQQSLPTNTMVMLIAIGSLALIAMTAAVPASVLAQNTELSTNANNKLKEQQQHQPQPQQPFQLQQQQLASVKDEVKEPQDVATVAPADKKSSPEIVPASFSNLPPSSSSSSGIKNSNYREEQMKYALPTNEEILAAVASAAAQNHPFAEESSAMHKRGINYDYNPYASGDNYAVGNYGGGQSPYGSDVPQGVWTDDYETAPAVAPVAPLNYNDRDLQELDDYLPERRVGNLNNRNKAYDNLQNLLNAEAYLESIPLSVPLNYANRNYALDADRNKRGIYYNIGSNGENLNKYRRYGDMRLKRDSTKLTPADMLALVALVEAGERARKETDLENPIDDSYGPKSLDSDSEYMGGNGANGAPPGAWLEAAAAPPSSPLDYYNMPVNVETMPKYEFIPRQHKYSAGNNRYGSGKSYVSVKRKRSVNQFFNEPVAERAPIYNGESFY